MALFRDFKNSKTITNKQAKKVNKPIHKNSLNLYGRFVFLLREFMFVDSRYRNGWGRWCNFGMSCSLLVLDVGISNTSNDSN